MKERLFNPDEKTRGFSQPVTLIPDGAGLLLDSRVLLSTGYVFQRAQTMLYVVVSRGVPVVTEKRLEHGFIWRGDLDYEERDLKKVGIRLDTRSRGRVYVGNEYKIIFTELNSGNSTARIESVQPVKINVVVNPSIPFREFLHLRENLGSH